MRRFFAVLFAAGLLAGCTDADWDHSLSYVGLGGAKETPPAAAPAPQAAVAPVADTWCAEVAKAAQTEAAEQGFDNATQQRRAVAAFSQCSRDRAQ